MANLTLNASQRSITGKSTAKKFRREDKIPGVYYFHGEKNIALLFDEKELRAVIKSETPIIDLKFDSETKPCVIRDVQFDKVNGKLLHVDLMGISYSEKLRTTVPIYLEGVPSGVKDGGGILQQLLREVEIEVLPADLPERIEIDITHLNINDHLAIADIKRDNIAFLHEDTEIIALVSPPITGETEVEKPAAAEEEEESAEPEVIGRGKQKEETEE